MGLPAAAAPYAVPALGAGLNALFGGGQQEQRPMGVPYVTNPYQQALQHQMQKRALQGNVGDSGFGSFVKQGKSQLQNFLAQQGISQDSGVGIAGMGNMIANASAQDAQNRHTRMMDLAMLSPTITQGEREDRQRIQGQFDPTGQFVGPTGHVFNPYDPNNLPPSSADPWQTGQRPAPGLGG